MITLRVNSSKIRHIKYHVSKSLGVRRASRGQSYGLRTPMYDRCSVRQTYDYGRLVCGEVFDATRQLS